MPRGFTKEDARASTRGFRKVRPLSFRTVYVVDDDRDVRLMLSYMLAEADLQSRPFASGADFLAAQPDLAPGCVLLDVRMPEMDGLTVMAELTRRSVGWPVMFMTGHGEVPVAVEAIGIWGDLLLSPKSPSRGSFDGRLSAACLASKSAARPRIGDADAAARIEHHQPRMRGVSKASSRPVEQLIADPAFRCDGGDAPEPPDGSAGVDNSTKRTLARKRGSLLIGRSPAERPEAGEYAPKGDNGRRLLWFNEAVSRT